MKFSTTTVAILMASQAAHTATGFTFGPSVRQPFGKDRSRATSLAAKKGSPYDFGDLPDFDKVRREG